MNYLPSKELLSEVLGHKIWKVMDCNMGTLRYCIYPNKGDEPSEYIFPINIYELAHKCKEKAYTNKYRLSSGQHRLNTKQEYYINNQIASYFCSVYYITNDDSDIQIDANTEPEAILRAYQWTIDNRS